MERNAEASDYGQSAVLSQNLAFGNRKNRHILRQDSQTSHQGSILDPWLFIRYIKIHHP